MRRPSNVILLLLSLMVALLLLEGGLRVAARFMPMAQPDTLQSEPHLYDAYRSHRINPAFNTPANTEGRHIHSADGFRRASPVSIIKPPRTIRILVMGGSALYGIGSFAPYPPHPYLRNDETITAHLEQMLNAHLKETGSPVRTEVINCGVIAYQTFQHLVYLNQSLLNLHPDIVINFDGNNDFYITDRKYNHWEDYIYGSNILVQLINERRLLIAAHLFFRWLSPYSLIAGQVEKRLTGPLVETSLKKSKPTHAIQPCPKDDPACQEDVARRTFLRALWQINRLGQLEGYDHVVFLQPEVVFENPQALTPHDQAVQKTTLRNMNTEDVQAMVRLRGSFPTLFSKYGIGYHDVAELGPKTFPGEDLYLDYCHLTPAGSIKAAQAMFPVILDMVLRRAKAMR